MSDEVLVYLQKRCFRAKKRSAQQPFVLLMQPRVRWLSGLQVHVVGHVELLVTQHPQVLLLRAAPNPFSTRPVFVLGIAPTHAQDPALGLVGLPEVCTGPLLHPAQVPLDGTPWVPLDGTPWVPLDGIASLQCSTTLPSLVPLAISLWVRLVLLSLTEMLNSTSPSTDPGGTALGTGTLSC